MLGADYKGTTDCVFSIKLVSVHQKTWVFPSFLLFFFVLRSKHRGYVIRHFLMESSFHSSSGTQQQSFPRLIEMTELQGELCW